jgi:gluconokinase
MRAHSVSTGKSDLVLTIDVGSSSLRTNLYTPETVPLDEAGADALRAQVPYQVRLTPGGGVEIDPDALLECLAGAIDHTLGQAGESARAIRGVGTCSLVSNVMGVDSRGRPTTPIFTWADTRCAAEAAELRSVLDERAIHQRTGCPIHSAYLPARLLWLKRSAPEAYARTTKWISLGEWIHLRLFGEAAQSLSVASWGGLLDRGTLDWDSSLLAFLEIDRDRLPGLAAEGEAISGLRGEYAERWSALERVPWYPCVADGVTSNVGCGCLTAEDLAVQVGTSGAMRAIVPGTPPEVPRGLWCYRVDHESSLLGGSLSEGGNVLSWLRDTLNVQDLEILEHEAAGLAPDAHGLTMLPFFAGERSPGWSDAARATVAGLSLRTSPADLMRAAQEAIAYRFGAIYDLLRSPGSPGEVSTPSLPPPRRIVASGSALLNVEGWLSILADVLGAPVTASASREASSRGTAMLTFRSLGILPDLSKVASPLGETFLPDKDRHAIYQRAMQRQQKLYEALER